jgi:hypothetical protein
MVRIELAVGDCAQPLFLHESREQEIQDERVMTTIAVEISGTTLETL